ncbi:MAG TPA: GNAT family N-acetyltransferase, partial [Alphaproteobacteria bacterium]|nr:GNAT family N-acetyltransferase [Alphaproteobacteria bacterium]
WIGAGGVRVTEVDGVVAGFIAAAPLGQALHIHVLAVHHHHQRQGIGTALLAATRIAAAEQGFGEMTLTTFANVSFNAPFYARLGFRIEPAPPAPLAAILNAEARRGLTDRCAMRAVFRL